MKSCSFCAVHTVEKARLLEDELCVPLKLKYKDHEANSEGLICIECGNFACLSCVSQIFMKTKKCTRKEDLWCQKVAVYLEQPTKQPPNFIGHCCEWKVQRKVIDAARKAEELHEWSAPRRFNGYLHLPEYGLLLDPPLAGAVDVHAFGESEGT